MSHELPPECLSGEGAELPISVCPSCGYRMDAATAVDAADPARPRPGDYSICLDCGSILVFLADYTHRLMTEEEAANLEDETRIQFQRIRKALLQVTMRKAARQ